MVLVPRPLRCTLVQKTKTNPIVGMAAPCHIASWGLILLAQNIGIASPLKITVCVNGIEVGSREQQGTPRKTTPVLSNYKSARSVLAMYTFACPHWPVFYSAFLGF